MHYSTDGLTLWFTGLPCAGKTTVSRRVAELLRRASLKVEVLDADTIRTNLSKGLGSGTEDRDANGLRVAFVCDLLSRNRVIAIAALVSPYRATRLQVRENTSSFNEIFVDWPVEECIRRDVNGMYRMALSGEIQNFIDDLVARGPLREVLQ